LAAFASGVATQGNVVVNAGVVPTPALALAARDNACVAVAITASHNLWHDNGVKVFAPGGRKLSDDQQRRIELLWQSSDAVSTLEPVGVNAVSPHVAQGYVAALTHGLSLASFGGREILIDCANGATSTVVSSVMQALQIRADIRHAEPNGRNINDGCGATHPQTLSAECAQRGVIGIAFDGDGDRLIAVDEQGHVVDGDCLIALAAVDLLDRGLLTHNTVVVTSMTNLGFHRAMAARNITVVTTDVGDRAVLVAMEAGGYVLGGEQSGHLIHALHATTGDGMLSALLLLDIVRRSGRSLSDLASAAMQRLPQVLRNVRVSVKPSNIELLLAHELQRERALLGNDGRIVLRTSGTEPVVRIMVEAVSVALADEVTTRLEQVVRSRT
jgi:phosphoglucosamine mutase